MNNGLFVYALIVVCITIFLTSLLLTFYRKTRYLKIFSSAYVCYLSSYILLALQSYNNLFFSSVISNIFLVAGSSLLIRSVRSYYTSNPEWPKRFWIYLALTGAISYVTAILSYNVIFRNILLGVLTVLIFIDFGIYILGRLNRMSPIIRGAILISLLINTMTAAIRPVIALMFLSPQKLPVESNVLNMFVFTSFTVTSILWLGTLILLDSDRMLNETKSLEEKYKAIMDSSDAGVVMIHRQGYFLFVNPIAAAMLKKTQEELLGNDIRDLFPLSQQEILLADIEQVILIDQGLTKETVATIAGETRYFLTSMQPIHNEFGVPYAVMILTTDISDIRIAQEQTKQSETNYRTLFSESPSANIIYHNNRIIDCNNAAEKLLGVELAQILGLTVGDISPEYQPNGKKSGEFAVEILQDALQTKLDLFEWVLKRFDGTEFIVYVKVNAIICEGKQVVLATWIDVTDQRKAEQDMRKLSVAVEQSPVSIVITNIDGTIEYANPKASETTGYPLEELAGENPRVLQSGDTSKEEYVEIWNEIQHGNEWRGIFHNKRKNGELYWESAVISPIMNESGNITHYIGIKEDITAQKKTEEELLINQKRLTEVTEHSRTVIWEMDAEGKYTYINDVCQVLYGFSPGELVGRYNYEIVPPDVREANKDSFNNTGFQILLEGNSLTNFERQILRKDGTAIWVSTSATPIFDKDNNMTGFMGEDNDITARKVAEGETLKFKTIADQANYGNAIASLDGILMYVNETFSKMHGWDTDELLGQNLISLHGQEDLERVNFLLEKIKTKGGFAAEELGQVRKDGTRFDSLMSAKVILDSNNAPAYMSATVMDISDVKKKDNEIKKLSIAIEQSPVAVVITDIEGFIQYVSPAFEVITGYCTNEVIGKHTRILGSGKTKPEVYNEMWETILAGKIWKGEWINKKKDGELYFESISITPVKEEEGRVTYFLAVKENITQRKNMEVTLIKSEEQFRSMFMESPVSIIIHDKDSGEVLDCNPEALRILGLSTFSELNEYKGWNDSPYSLEDYNDHVKSVAQSSPQQFEWQIKNVSGVMIWESVSMILLEIGGEKRVVATTTNTTKEKLAEQDRVARLAAEESNRAKSVFFSSMSHEIRTPLNVINGFAQILDRDQTLTPKQSEHVNTILHSGEHLVRLINDILDISKIEAAQLNIKEQEFNLQNLLADLKSMFSLSAKQKNLYLEFELDESVPKYIYADEAKLRQVFINLLGNAFKFTSTGGIKVRLRAGQKTKERVPLFVEVIDTGHGISDDNKKHLFELYWQGASGQAMGGTGLGLPICKSIIDLMGGKITVESKVGQGSNFKFYILFKPLEKEKEDEIIIQHKAVGLAPGIGPFRILIADDRADNRNLLRELLQPMGFEVWETENGQEAVDIFTKWKPHAILLDMLMPVMDGYEAIRRIRATEQGKSVLLVGITASVLGDDLIKVKEAGADEVLLKPFRTEKLFAILLRVPGVSYIYEQDKEEKHTKFEKEPYELAIMKLSLELVTDMRTAVEQGNMVQFRKLVEQVDKVSSSLTKELLNLSRNYEYEKLLALFQNEEDEINE